MRVLLTGGAGFIGAHVAEHILATTDDYIVLLDKIDHAGNLNRLGHIANWEKYQSRCRVIYHDLRAPINDLVTAQIGKVTAIYHLAAATHVDRSIQDPLSFVYDNVVATCNVLEFARRVGPQQMVYFSTDEVFGPAPVPTRHREDACYNARNPYAATKAGAEQLCLAYHNTYGVPVKIVHVMNVFGERQHPEKFIPMTIAKVLHGEEVIVHSDPSCKIAGSRFYIHARNAAAALEFVTKRGGLGESFNIVGEREVDNLTLAKTIAEIIGKPLNYRMVDFHSSRPGHDLRYALDGSKLAKMGWMLPETFEQSLGQTVRWSLDNPEWLHVS